MGRAASKSRIRPRSAFAAVAFFFAKSAVAVCPLLVRPEHASASWDAAVERVEARLVAEPGDCRQLELSVDRDGTALTFTTLDGRRAVRLLQNPAELDPTVSALLTELPTPPTRADAVTRSDVSPARSAAPLRSSVPGPALRLSGLGGARIAGPAPLVTPAFGVGAALSLSNWEVGVTGAFCPSYVSLGDDSTVPTRLSSIAAGIAVGRRVPLGKSVTLLGGGTLAAAFEHEEWRPAGTASDHESERGQMLLGAYGGAAFPARWKTHFISTLAADFDATHAGAAATTVEGAPALPWWGLSLSVGVESEVL